MFDLRDRHAAFAQEPCAPQPVEVVGIGGGTCLDITKTIAFGVKQSGDIGEYLTYAKTPDTTEHLPVGTIITFPSSGSDMNGSTQILGVETEGRGIDEIVHDGMQAMFALYRKYGMPTRFSQIRDIREDDAALRECIEQLGPLESIYTDIDTKTIMRLIREAV